MCVGHLVLPDQTPPRPRGCGPKGRRSRRRDGSAPLRGMSEALPWRPSKASDSALCQSGLKSERPRSASLHSIRHPAARARRTPPQDGGPTQRGRGRPKAPRSKRAANGSRRDFLDPHLVKPARTLHDGRALDSDSKAFDSLPDLDGTRPTRNDPAAEGAGSSSLLGSHRPTCWP